MFNEYSLKKEKSSLQYKQAKLSYLSERMKEINKPKNIIMKAICWLPDNHIRAEYQFLSDHQQGIQDRLYEVNRELRNM